MSDCYFSKIEAKHIDYKDVETLKKFVNLHGRMIARKRTDVCAKHQRQIANAIKRARYMGLMPYIAK